MGTYYNFLKERTVDMKLFTAIFPDSGEMLIAESARRIWYRGYHILRARARFDSPEQFTHMDIPAFNVTATRFTIPEDRSDDGKFHTTTCIERTVF